MNTTLPIFALDAGNRKWFNLVNSLYGSSRNN